MDKKSRKSSGSSPSRRKSTAAPASDKQRRISESSTDMSQQSAATAAQKGKDKKLKNMLGKERGSLQKKWGTMVGELEDQMGSTDRKQSRRTSRSVERKVSRIDDVDGKFDKLKEALRKKRSSSVASSRHAGSESGASEISARSWNPPTTPNTRRKSRIAIVHDEHSKRTRLQSRGDGMAPEIGMMGSEERRRSRSQGRVLDGGYSSSRDTPDIQHRRRSQSQSRLIDSRMSTPEIHRRASKSQQQSGGRTSRASRSEGSDMETLQPARGRSHSRQVVSERRISVVNPHMSRSHSQGRLLDSPAPRSSLATSHRSSSASRLDNISLHSADGRRSSKETSLKNAKALNINEKHTRGDVYRYSRPLNPGEAPMTAKERKKGVKFFKDVRDEAGEIVDEVLGRAVKAVYGKDAKHYTRNHKSKSYSDITNVHSTVNNIHDVRRISNIHDIRRVSNTNAVRRMSTYDQQQQQQQQPQRRQSHMVVGQERRRSSIRPIPQSGATKDGSHPPKSSYRDIDFDIEIGGGSRGGPIRQAQTNINETTYNNYHNQHHGNYGSLHSPDSTRTVHSSYSEASSHVHGYSTPQSYFSDSALELRDSTGADSNAASESRSGRVNPPTLTRGAITRVLHELNDSKTTTATTNAQVDYATNTWPLKVQTSSNNTIIDQSYTLPRVSSVVSESTSVKTAQSTPHIVQLMADDQPKIHLAPHNGPMSPKSADHLTDKQLSQQGATQLGHEHYTVYHGQAKTSQPKPQSEANQANALTIQANLPTIREEDEARYGAYSNEPIIVADLVDYQGIKRSKGLADSKLVASQETTGKLYGTQPDVAMNRHQVLNFYLFNQQSTGEPKPKLGYVAQEMKMKKGDETQSYANVYINRDGSEEQKREVKEWLAEQRPKSEASEDTELREAYIFHKQTQTMQSPQPSPPRRMKKEIRTQQVVTKPSPPPSPPKRKHRETTHYITQTREIEKVPPEKHLRSMSIQTDAPPPERIKKARSVVLDAPTMLTSETTMYDEYDRPPTPMAESYMTETVTSTTVPRITENRHMEQRIEFQEPPPTPPIKVVPMHLKQNTHTDVLTLIERELEPPKTEVAPVEESESDSDETVILEMGEIETREQRIAMAIFEEVEFSYKKIEGGKVVDSGSSDRCEIPPFWLPNRYEAVVDRKKQKMTQVRETSQQGLNTLQSEGFPTEHQRHLEAPDTLLALPDGDSSSDNVQGSSYRHGTQSRDPKDHIQVTDYRKTESSQQPKSKRVHRSSVHHEVTSENEAPEHHQTNEQFKREDLPANKVSALLNQFNSNEKILANPGMKPADKHGFKPIENEDQESPKRTSSLKRQSAFRKVQKTIPVPNGNDRQGTDQQSFRSEMHVGHNEQRSPGSSGGAYYNSLNRSRTVSGGSSSGKDFALSPISVPNVDVPNYPNHIDGDDDNVEPESLEIFERSTRTKTMNARKAAPPPPPPPPPPLKLNHSAQEQHQAHIINQKASRQDQWIDSFMSQTPPPHYHPPPSPTKTHSSAANSKMRKSHFDPENVSFGKKTGADMMRESNEMSFNLEKINVPSTPSSPTKKHTFEELEGHLVHSSQSEPKMQTKYTRDKDGNLVKVTELQHTLTKTVEYESDEEKRRRNSASNEQLGDASYIKMDLQQMVSETEEKDESPPESPHEYTGPEVVAEMERTLRPYYFESQSQTLDMREGQGTGLADQRFLYDMDTATLKPVVMRERDERLERYGETMTTEL